MVGAGLAGLTAALIAAEAGAKVELVAQGQGALTLHPGWIEIGDVERAGAAAGSSLRPRERVAGGGVGLIDRIAGLQAAGDQAITGLGTRRQIAYTVGQW